MKSKRLLAVLSFAAVLMLTSYAYAGWATQEVCTKKNINYKLKYNAETNQWGVKTSGGTGTGTIQLGWIVKNVTVDDATEVYDSKCAS
jgi:hypothetical protein